MGIILDLLVLVVISINATNGNLTVETRPLSRTECGQRLAAIREKAPRNVMAWCAEPGQSETFFPNTGS